MKKYYLLTIIFACFVSAISFAQMDSSDYRKSQKQMMKAEQRRVKQEKRVKHASAKMEKSQKRLNRQNRKMNKANRRSNNEMRDVNREQQKLEEAKKDSVPNTSYIIRRSSNIIELQSKSDNHFLKPEGYFAIKPESEMAI
jgi:septal ring factor EnvC (AmiA/AmiB activator)